MIVLAQTDPEEDFDEDLLRLAAAGGAFDFLADPAEDIYTPEDGEAYERAA